MEIHEGGIKKLKHFSFSCRILNMGVEHFVYDMLNRPTLEINGDVQSNPKEAIGVNWITLKVNEEATTEKETKKSETPYFLRGGAT